MSVSKFPIKRRTLLAGSAATLALGAAPAWAAYPDKPIKIIVPWAAGGSTDAITRVLAQRLSEGLKQPVVVDNKPGGAGHVGMDQAAKSAPDGYTLAIIELSHVYAPAVVANLPYDILRDFTPVTLVGTSPMVLFTGPDVTDFKSFLKSVSNPKGGPSAMANSGTGSISHLVGELFSQETKVKFNMVPYRGGAPAMVDLAAGQVSSYFATLATGSSLMASGKVKALAVTGRKRSDVPILRSLPTMTELGLKNMDVAQWWALVAPATTPLEVTERLRLELLSAMSDLKVVEKMSALGVEMKGTSRDQLRSFLRSESERWRTLARNVGLKPQ
ncbi:tripartite tricarboxylate transporter substrate binding protein [Polaromonas sp. JS666]|uniref:Bug family tripartite tricarboxylate transporter substrate binding protein n=1 Tax=Polaromonas sp. (strain JS666 / ATCC BAA-500) TaxID=296591 RepID=UPI00088C4C69|nr:tripartite tricarboxylate transporter substrate-binding protein [Polaromonas sp. JS666]SDM74745.1 Tripartite-type tricarboxylate transporter, receptor component TctC [Polaromonas sp. JS666]